MTRLAEAKHLTHCFAELTVMYARETAMRIGETVLDALDCFGDDSAEDAAVHTNIWGSNSAAVCDPPAETQGVAGKSC